MTKTKKKHKEEAEEALNGYESVFRYIVSKIRAAQARALTAVNRELIGVYREIGKVIYDQQREKDWGRSIVEYLGSRSSKRFSRCKGIFAS